MRVLITTFTYLPNRDGVSTAAAAMAKGLSAKGHEVTVATYPEAHQRAPSIDGVPIHEFAVNAPKARTQENELRRFKAWVSNGAFDAVLCHCWHTPLTDAVAELGDQLAARKILVSHGYTFHVVDWRPYPFWGLGPWLRTLPLVFQLPSALRRFDWVTVLAMQPNFRRGLDLLVARWTGFRKISSIPNGTDPERFNGDGHLFREKYEIGDELLFLCVANYVPHKNQELALRAFRRANLPAATLVFIGSELGDYGQRVCKLDEMLPKSKNPGRVLFLEKLSQDLISSAYAACDVFVLSATRETQPIVIIEAMAAGKPWISTDTGCVREFSGGIVVSGEEAMSAAMERLAADPELRAELAAQARGASREKYTWSASMDAYDALLRRLLPKPHTTGSST